MNHSTSIAALGFGLASWSIWIANALEVSLFRPHACTLQRMQFESWVFLARAAAIVMPVAGLVLALIAMRDARVLRGSGLIVNGAALLFVAALFMRIVTMGHLPCLRD